MKAKLVKESLNESMSRYCDFYKAKNGKWYMDLASDEYGEYNDADTYGPFDSLEDAEEYLHDNFSNPGSSWEDSSGKREVPTESPNGSSVKSPRRSGGYGGYGGRFTGVRW